MTHVDTSNFALKINLASLKTEADKLDIDKLTPVPVDLSKLLMVAKVNQIDTSDFMLKTKYQTDKTEWEKKSTNVTEFVKNAKLTELEKKILDVSSLVLKIALTAVKNKIPSVSNLVKKTNYNTKITEIQKIFTDRNHDQRITTPYYWNI